MLMGRGRSGVAGTVTSEGSSKGYRGTAVRSTRLRRAALSALDEVDDQRHAVEAVARAQAVLEEVGVVARDAARELTWIAKRGGRSPIWAM